MCKMTDWQQRDCKVPSKKRDCKIVSDCKCRLKCCKSCTFCNKAAAKERYRSRYCSSKAIKICSTCFHVSCRSIEFCPECNKCQKQWLRSTCRGKTTPVLGNLRSLGAGPKVIKILKEGYSLPFQIWPNLTRSLTIISCCEYAFRRSHVKDVWLYTVVKTM